MKSTTKTVAVLMGVLALVAAACGSVSDTAAEQLAEELIEASGDGDVSVDISGDGDDVTIEMETEDGSISIGAGTELPDSLEVPVPDGGDVTTSVEMEDGVLVVVTYPDGDYDAIVTFYDDWTAATGEAFDRQSMSLDTGGPDQRSTTWIGPDSETFVSVGDCFDVHAEESSGEEFNAVCVNINQAG